MELWDAFFACQTVIDKTENVDDNIFCVMRLAQLGFDTHILSFSYDHFNSHHWLYRGTERILLSAPFYCMILVICPLMWR
jgi:hypothetical protein